MSEEKVNKRLSRRQFLKGAAVVTGAAVVSGSLLEACAPAAPTTPTKAPAAPSAATPATKAAVTPAAEVKPAAGPPLKIGVLLPYSKVYAVLGESITNGMVLYFESIGNTIAGRKIDLIKEDEENDAQASLRKTRKFIEQDKVDLMTGLVNSAIAYAVRDIVHDNKMILLISNAGANGLTREKKSPYIFRTSFSNWQPNYPMGDWVAKHTSKKVFCSAADYAAGKEMIAAFKETFVPAGGTVLGEIYPPLGNTDYGPYLAKIAEAKPEATYSFYSGSDAVAFVKQYEEYGLKKTAKLTGAGWLVEQDVLPAQGKAALGAISGLNWANTLDIPENKKFIEAYQKKFNVEPNSFAVQGFDTARVIHEAIEKTKGNTSDKDALIKALESVKFASPRGPFEFDPVTHNVIQNIYVREVKEVGGKLANVVIDTIKAVKDPGK
ncbi:MAG: ABC transporter substrate-binding protein [Chloroflexi bacterium]|nr:ABC transporter substrate-binding protein [Chloroflexota bacterium]MDA8186812.1 ABC transporter substrate-binding protein [Dehalococcoidales bacterium]